MEISYFLHNTPIDLLNIQDNIKTNSSLFDKLYRNI